MAPNCLSVIVCNILRQKYIRTTKNKLGTKVERVELWLLPSISVVISLMFVSVCLTNVKLPHYVVKLFTEQ